jgi:SMC interacting uncharacterized protein involved in chromosome segregation
LQFREIKKQLGLKNDTEVMRYLIVSFRSMKEKERKLDDFLEKLYDKVERLEHDLKALEEQLRSEKHEV